MRDFVTSCNLVTQCYVIVNDLAISLVLTTFWGMGPRNLACSPDHFLPGVMCGPGTTFTVSFIFHSAPSILFLTELEKLVSQSATVVV